MLEKPKRAKQLNNQDRQLPATIQELINRYDLENKDIYKFLDYLIDKINSDKNTVVDSLENIEKAIGNIEEQARALNEKIVGTVLYEDEVGATGNVTLSDSKDNYDDIEIQGYLKTGSSGNIGFSSGKMPARLKSFNISMNRCVSDDSVQFCQELLTIEGSSCIRTYGNFITYIGLTPSNQDKNKFYITRITGYKY